MKVRVAHLALVLGLAGMAAVGCGSDDDTTTPPKGGAGGVAGSAGKSGSAGKGGTTTQAGSGNESGSAGEGGAAAGAGPEQGGAAGDQSAGSAGMGGEGGSAGYPEWQIERGKVLVRSVALCGGCHTQAATSTDPAGPELGGNLKFKNGTLPAPNLTDDPAGIGDWTDQQVINAFRDGIDDEGRQLDSIMPYWLFHNMSDADAHAIVAFLRSLPHVSVAVGEANPAATTVAPAFPPSALPDTTLDVSSPDHEAAVQGKYLVSGVAQCVKCHSPSSNGLPVADFFSGVPPTSITQIFASNLTPDATGLLGWTADDVATALKTGMNKTGRTLCGSMPSGAKGYGGMSDADAHAIGVYMTTIPPVSKPSAAPGLEPACPTP